MLITTLDSNNDVTNQLLKQDDTYWMVFTSPNYASALGDDRMTVIFEQISIAIHNQYSMRFNFACAGAMRYPGCHSDVVFDERGVAK